MNLYTKRQNKSWLQDNYLQGFLVKIGILAFLIVFLNIFSSQVKNMFYATSYPISRLLSQSTGGIYDFFNNFLKANTLGQENDRLKKENQTLLHQLSLMKDSVSQANDLHDILQRLENDNLKVLQLNIVGMNLANDVIVVDKGLHDGVLQNMPLISKEKVVYGTVMNVYKNFSEVLLISAKQNTFDIKIQSDDPGEKVVHGIIKGNGNLSVYLDLVDFDSQIKEGDILVTSGLEGLYPRDLLVGKILSVNRSDVKPFQTAKIQAFLDFRSIESLFLITNHLK